jgi:hypothetical protein
MGNLDKLDVEAVINYAGVGFVRICASSNEGDILTGLLPIDKARDLGRSVFRQAEVADTEVLVYELLKNILDLDDDAVSDFMIEFRKAREE